MCLSLQVDDNDDDNSDSTNNPLAHFGDTSELLHYFRNLLKKTKYQVFTPSFHYDLYIRVTK